jgi:hypothetical protein
MINDIMGSDFDYLCLPAHGAAGGVLIAWRSDLWDGTLPNIGRFSVVDQCIWSHGDVGKKAEFPTGNPRHPCIHIWAMVSMRGFQSNPGSQRQEQWQAAPGSYASIPTHN